MWIFLLDQQRFKRQSLEGNTTIASTRSPVTASASGSPDGNGSPSVFSSASGPQNGNSSSSSTEAQKQTNSFVKPDSFIDPSFGRAQSGAGGSSASVGSSLSDGGSNSSSSDGSHGPPFQSPAVGGSQPFMPSFLDPSKFMLGQQQLGQGGGGGIGSGGAASGTSLTGSGSTSGLSGNLFHPPSFFMNPSGGGQTSFSFFNPNDVFRLTVL
ncbi:hypothetical protein CHS0354_015543 [Potamilus streckersoni]|uniref:Uncharacterized protein n=1 Tax=Potamilus streckersoni TaxID=2493646 RepID=A0AAE0W6Y4_9BIVA|nr:hypothetical protein CHS0354_015543 [Potamilus streckersoni]